MNSLFKTTYFRVSFFTLAVSAACIIALSSSVYFQARDILIHQNDQALNMQIQTLSLLPENKIIESIQERVDDDYRQVFFGGVFNGTGQKLAGNLATEPSAKITSGQPKAVKISQVPNDIRMISKKLDNGDMLYVGIDIKLISEIKLILLTATLVCIASMALGGGIIGIIRSAKVVRNLRSIHEITNFISEGDFRVRIKIITGNNEIDELVKQINNMMSSIENLTIEITSINKNISHNLFSPMVRLRGIIGDVSSLILTNSNEKDSIILDKAQKEIEMIIKRFSALQRISSIESRSRYSGMSFFKLSDLKVDLQEIFEPYSDETGTTFSVLDSDGFIFGDKGLLFEAIFNLVENSFKYCPPGSKITLLFLTSSEKTNIIVQDNGGGIPEGNLKEIVNRYYRSSEKYDVSGSGIGLSIVSSIARLHGFELKIENVNPGLKVSLIAENRNFRSIRSC